MNSLNNKVYDKHGRPVLPNDVLKVFHYIEPQYRRKVFMYKVAGNYVELGKDKTGKANFLQIFEIKSPPTDDKIHSYYVKIGQKMRDTEIVDGITTLPNGNVQQWYEREKEGKDITDYYDPT